MDKGQFYKKLNRSYIIFICPFDAYGKGRHIYTFKNICKEDKSISMGDGAVKIFLNAKGEWRHEYMTLLMRDRENVEKGKELMIINALNTTKSVKQTSFILQLPEEEVREIAESKNLVVND